MTRLDEVAATPLLDAGDRTWTWGDLLLAARLWGDWEPWLEGLQDPSVPDDVRAAEVAFRRERRLIAGDELRAWLTSHRLHVDEWRAWLRGEPAEPWTAGTCDGTFEHWTDRLAERAGALAAADREPATAPPPPAWFARMPDAAAAAAIGVPADEIARRAGELWQAERAHAQLCEDAAGADTIQRLVSANTVDWLRLDCELIQSADEDVAKEAALLVREDGMELPEVALAAGLDLQSSRAWAGDIATELRGRLVSAAPGELVGPIAVNGHFVLAHVRAKLVPEASDPDVRARAEQAARAQALERVVREEVRRRG